MDIANHIQNFIPEIDTPEKIYELFRSLGYHKDKILDPSYKRKVDEFEFAKDEREKVEEIYTVFNYDGKLQIFLIEVKGICSTEKANRRKFTLKINWCGDVLVSL
jgi:hypothetical protein